MKNLKENIIGKYFGNNKTIISKIVEIGDIEKLREILKLEQINIVAYERPAGAHKFSIMVASEMIGVLKELCEELKINYASYSASEIKKHATGKGNAKKDDMGYWLRNKIIEEYDKMQDLKEPV